MKKIGFVCTGNTCRSPMAEGIFRSLTKEFEVASMGIFPTYSSAATNAVLVMKQQGIDISNHVSSGLDNIGEFDLILTMTEDQAEMLNSIYKDMNIYSIKEFATGKKGDVIDPYGGSVDIYRNTADELRDLVIKIIQKLEEEII